MLWWVSLGYLLEGVNTGTIFGHWESDSIVGASNTGVVHTSAEGKSGFLCGVRISAITAVTTVEAQSRLFSRLSAHAVASVAAGNGSEFAHRFRLGDA